jgi:hypothetical protein
MRHNDIPVLIASVIKEAGSIRDVKLTYCQRESAF